MTFHYRKNKVERVAGGSISSSGGVHVQSNAIFNLNPHGRLGNEEMIYEIAGNTDDAEEILQQIEDKVRDAEDPHHLRFEYIHVRGMSRV